MQIGEVVFIDDIGYEAVKEVGARSCEGCNIFDNILYNKRMSTCERRRNENVIDGVIFKKISKPEPSHKDHIEAINVIRTIRAVVDHGFNDETFKQYILSILHATSRGCIGCDKDVEEEYVKFTLPKEWK